MVVLVAGYGPVMDAGGVASWSAAIEVVGETADEAVDEAAVEAVDPTDEGDAATFAQGYALCSVVASAVETLDRADMAAPTSKHPEQAAEDSARHSMESRAWTHRLVSAGARR